MVAAFLQNGWAQFPAEAPLRNWAAEARIAALARIADPVQRAQWLQCQGTWFVGVDTLPNDSQGRVGASAPLDCAATDAARDLYGALPLHPGQVSVTYPSYPRPRAGESDAAFRYRLNRCAAHVDGLLPVGADRRRMLRERHAFILGLPLTATGAGAAPLVVWEGSHHIMRAAFETALGGIDPRDWGDIDVTDVYRAARREVFATCPRLTVHGPPGTAYLVHRLALHGVAPWQEGASAPPEGRMVAYFRPQFGDVAQDAWLRRP